MSETFFEKPILNSPYDYPRRHWEIDEELKQPTNRIVEQRRPAKYLTPIPKSKKQKAGQKSLDLQQDRISTEAQAYDPTPIINELRAHVDRWRTLAPSQWNVTPETARLLDHWRNHSFNVIRPFFCQVEAVETAIWLTEVAPEAEFCRVAESHPRVRSYVKNHSLGFEVPYQFGAESRRYRPDFIVRIDDGRGDDDLLNLVVEIKGYRGEDAKEKKSTMDMYWIPGVNNRGDWGRWAFAELTDVWEMQGDFASKVEQHFHEMIDRVAAVAV